MQFGRGQNGNNLREHKYIFIKTVDILQDAQYKIILFQKIISVIFIFRFLRFNASSAYIKITYLFQ